MAQYIANSTGTFSTAATWDTVSNTPTINATTNITINTTNHFTATFTAPNLVNKSTGCAFYVGLYPTASQTWTATLYESGVVTAATSTVAYANITLANGWLYFRWGTPYTYTTTTTGAYKVLLVSSSATNNGNVRADSGAANPAFLHTDDRHTAPTVGDDWLVLGTNGSTTPVVVTPTGTGNSTGSGTDTTSNTTAVSIGLGGVISGGGTLTFDPAANTTLTTKGGIACIAGGTYNMVPNSYSIVHTLTFNENGTSGNYGLLVLNGGKTNFQGTVKTKYVTTYSSGDGSIGTPLITADSVNWTVGDNLVFAPTSNNATNYNEYEDFTISTVNSATSYVLSGPLINTHTSGWIGNVTSNVIINSTDTTHGWYGYHTGNAVGDVVYKWVRFDTIGSSATGTKQAAVYSQASPTTVDHCIFYNILSGCGGIQTVAYQVAQTHSDCLFYKHGGGGTAGYRWQSTPANQTINNMYFLRHNAYAILTDSGFNMTLTNTYANSCMLTGSDVAYRFVGSDWTISNMNGNTNNLSCLGLINCVNFVFTSCNFGTLGVNKTNDVICTTASIVNVVRFDSCNFGSATMFSGHTNLVSGSQVVFNTINSVYNKNIVYSNNGSFWATGAGLTDTNVRTSGTFNVRISPEITRSVTYSYYKVVKVGEAASALGFIQLNAAFTADAGASCVINLYLPGNQLAGATANATSTMAKADNNYNPFILAANYLGATPGLYRVDIVVTGSAGDYAYVADLDNGSNKLTDFEVWSLGQPSTIMPETLGDAVAMWSTAITALTASGSIGQRLSTAMRTGDFFSIK